jgi:hypothetical protein
MSNEKGCQTTYPCIIDVVNATHTQEYILKALRFVFLGII